VAGFAESCPKPGLTKIVAARRAKKVENFMIV